MAPLVHSVNSEHVLFSVFISSLLTSSGGEARVEAGTEDVVLVCVYRVTLGLSHKLGCPSFTSLTFQWDMSSRSCVCDCSPLIPQGTYLSWGIGWGHNKMWHPAKGFCCTASLDVTAMLIAAGIYIELKSAMEYFIAFHSFRDKRQNARLWGSRNLCLESASHKHSSYWSQINYPNNTSASVYLQWLKLCSLPPGYWDNNFVMWMHSL